MPPKSQPPPPPQTFAALLAAFTSFLTVAIHTILHQRALYPAPTFLTARAYNYPVRQSRHPQVCAWVADAVGAVEAELRAGRAARVALVIYSSGASTCRPLERFVWDVGAFPVVAREDRETVFAERGSGAAAAAGTGEDEGVGGGYGEGEEDEDERANVDLEEQFRAALARLSVCGSVLAPLPPGCTFTVAVELKEDAEPPVGHPQPWIPVQPSLQATKQQRIGTRGEAGGGGGGGGNQAARGEDLGGVKTTPLRAVSAGEMAFEMWIEEGRAKMEVGGLGSNDSSAHS